MKLKTAIGNGCAHCEVGRPIERIEVGRGRRKLVIELCLECVMVWFPDKTVDWWEARHAHFQDHVEAALKRSRQKEAERAVALAMTMGVALG